jgi:hypothetical protein
VQPVPSSGAQPLHMHCEMKINSAGRVSRGILHSFKPRFKANRWKGIAPRANVWLCGLGIEDPGVGRKGSEPTVWPIGSRLEEPSRYYWPGGAAAAPEEAFCFLGAPVRSVGKELSSTTVVFCTVKFPPSGTK